MRRQISYIVASLAIAGMVALGCDTEDGGSDDDDGGSGGTSSTGNSGASNASSGSGASSSGSGTASTGTGMPACDNTQCGDFCAGAGSCLFEGDTIDDENCLAACDAYCGNGYFDETDAALVACIVDLSALDCGGAATCCDEEFTSELCP